MTTMPMIMIFRSNHGDGGTSADDDIDDDYDDSDDDDEDDDEDDADGTCMHVNSDTLGTFE